MASDDPWRTDYSDVVMLEPPERIIPRDDWGADDAKDEVPMALPVSQIFLGFTDTEPCDSARSCVFGLMKIQTDYMEKENKSDLPYNFIIGGNGFAYEGRGWRVQPELPEKYSLYSARSLYIAYVGRKTDTGVPKDMVDSVNEVIDYGMYRGHITKKILLHYL